jgi:hypothetical protein
VIRSCPGCKLNRLPVLKQFIKSAADKYQDIEVQWISGHNPELWLYNKANEEIIEKLDLSGYTVEAELENFFQSKGIQRKAVNNEEDTNSSEDPKLINLKKHDVHAEM